jgi:hypothetical protein
MARSPLALGQASGRSKPLNAAKLLNLYPAPAPSGSMSQWALYGTPGQKVWSSALMGLLGDLGPIRAGREALGYLWVVANNWLVRFTNDYNKESPLTFYSGGVLPVEGNVTLVDNGTQLGILVGTKMFYVTGATTLSPTISAVTDADFPSEGATSVDFIDGYGVFTRGGESGQWFLSDLYDFSAYDALDFATAESAPDGLRKVISTDSEVWLFGDRTTEVWSNTGAAAFPFEPIAGATMQKGIAAPRSAIRFDNSLIWLGHDRIVYRAEGYRPVRISDHAVEELLRDGSVSDAYAMSHSIAGHQFYVLTLPSKGITLAYDAAPPSAWHLRQSGTSTSPAVWSPLCIFEAFGKTLVGGESGVIYELDLDTYLEGSNAIRRAVTSFPVYPDGQRGIMRSIELECELGVGLTTGQGSAPEAMLRFSKDGGVTFGNERRQSLGAKGSRRARAMWENLGMFRSGVAEISFSDPVKLCIYGAKYEVEGLAY